MLPLDHFITIEKKNGKIYVDGDEASGALKKGSLIVDFMVGKADNPKVNAIVLVSGGPDNTHEAAYNRYIEELNKLRV